ncbi:helix-turn-helix transcriptional regulator [Parabacteroides gordonii]|jgi:transcriptional regulator with XRE-family HTH domain|uniref:helix-turn-helix domain-containing protein n=1 Tax=Parabacteroides gordonii TaxID=574930 RepID=UPI00241F10FE|nr:helix-turn-helix transcriptional regulator [Parabacteroides gordonii]
METENVEDKRVHQGANVSKIRKIVGMKQNALAKELGVSQQFLSRLERQREIGKDYLDKIAAILKVTPEIIENMEETPVSVVIENNNFDFESGSNNSGIGYVNENEANDNKIIHPVEKIIELTRENTSLYERMLANEKEKVTLLEKLLNQKK